MCKDRQYHDPINPPILLPSTNACHSNVEWQTVFEICMIPMTKQIKQWNWKMMQMKLFFIMMVTAWCLFYQGKAIHFMLSLSSPPVCDSIDIRRRRVKRGSRSQKPYPISLRRLSLSPSELPLWWSEWPGLSDNALITSLVHISWLTLSLF